MTAPAQTARRGIPVLGPLSTTARIAVVATVAISIAAIVLDFVLHANETLLFIVSAVAILGLAWIVGLSTERLGAISGPQVGGILNATFGNIAELIIAFFALQAGLIDVVKASITGSIIGNLLLVLGASVLLGTTQELGLMVWGEVAEKKFNYEVAVVAGEGVNRPQLDESVDFVGRVFAKPLLDWGRAIKGKIAKD